MILTRVTRELIKICFDLFVPWLPTDAEFNNFAPGMLHAVQNQVCIQRLFHRMTIEKDGLRYSYLGRGD